MILHVDDVDALRSSFSAALGRDPGHKECFYAGTTDHRAVEFCMDAPTAAKKKVGWSGMKITHVVGQLH